MNNFERFVRVTVADRALCEAIMTGYRAYMEAETPTRKVPDVFNATGSAAARPADGKKQKPAASKVANAKSAASLGIPTRQIDGMPSKESADVKARYGFDPDKLDNSKSVHFSDGYAKAQAQHGQAKRSGYDLTQDGERAAAANSGRASRAPAASAGTSGTPGDQTQLARKAVAPAKRVAKARPAKSQSSSEMVDDSKKTPALYEPANEQVAEKAQEFYDGFMKKWKDTYGEEAPEEHKVRMHQAAVKQAGQWYKNFIAQDHRSTGLRMVDADGNPRVRHSATLDKARAMLGKGDEAVDNIAKTMSGDRQPKARHSRTMERSRELLKKGDDAMATIKKGTTQFEG